MESLDISRTLHKYEEWVGNGGQEEMKPKELEDVSIFHYQPSKKRRVDVPKIQYEDGFKGIFDSEWQGAATELTYPPLDNQLFGWNCKKEENLIVRHLSIHRDKSLSTLEPSQQIYYDTHTIKSYEKKGQQPALYFVTAHKNHKRRRRPDPTFSTTSSSDDIVINISNEDNNTYNLNTTNIDNQIPNNSDNIIEYNIAPVDYAPFFHAIHNEDVKRLVSLGPIPQGFLEQKDSQNYDYKAIHLAAKKRNTEIIDILLKAGADVNEPYSNSSTPLHQAAGQGHLDIIVHLMLNGASAFNYTRSNWLPVHVASTKKKDDAVNFFMDYYFKNKEELFNRIRQQVDDSNFKLKYCDYTSIEVYLRSKSLDVNDYLKVSNYLNS